MSCVLYKDGETLLCEPTDMAREIAVGWSVCHPDKKPVETPANDEPEPTSEPESTIDPEPPLEEKTSLIGRFKGKKGK